MQISEADKFGITLIMIECAFSAELQRNSIEDMMAQIDSQLTEQGAPDDSALRIEMMMDNASTISKMMAAEEIEHEEGVADIAYSAIYAFGKSIGFDQIATLRGLTGTLMRNVLSLNPCLGDLEYEKETKVLQQAMQNHDDDDGFPPISNSRTIH